MSSLDTLTDRIRSEFRELPGLKITFQQACRLWHSNEVTMPGRAGGADQGRLSDTECVRRLHRVAEAAGEEREDDDSGRGRCDPLSALSAPQLLWQWRGKNHLASLRWVRALDNSTPRVGIVSCSGMLSGPLSHVPCVPLISNPIDLE
jgi:hypothetical protein